MITTKHLIIVKATEPKLNKITKNELIIIKKESANKKLFSTLNSFLLIICDKL
jgi:hypothetical protein